MGWSWAATAVAVVLTGAGVRLALDPGGVGGWSAALMTVLLGLSVWLGAWLLATPRTAFVATLGLVVLLDLAALPPRTAPEYDDRQALFQTDQVLAAQASIAPAVVRPGAAPVLTLLVEPTFNGAQPRFGLGGDVGGSALAWDCPFQRGMQHLALPVPIALPAGAASIDVRLHLTGSPTRESDYLLVYTSSAQHGLLVSLVGAGDVGQGATLCVLR